MTTVENQYLVGNFAPVKDELTVTDLPVEGAIPPEINGRYLRNGPNPIAPDPAAYHWFTGDVRASEPSRNRKSRSSRL